MASIRAAADEADTQIAAVVDVETSGLDPDDDAITELAICRFRFDPKGRLVTLDTCYSWFEDPGRPLDPEIVKLTGITDDMVKGAPLVAVLHSRWSRRCVLGPSGRSR